MFLDTAKIKVKAGNGGDGMVAFRREKYVPNGGPWGGDGGRGGNVVFVVDEGLRTLMDFRYNRHFKAQSGEKGMTKGMHGRGAEDLIVRVPQGTTVRDADTGKVLTDLVENGQEFIVARGGRGGYHGSFRKDCHYRHYPHRAVERVRIYQSVHSTGACSRTERPCGRVFC